jgi:dimethylargininase
MDIAITRDVARSIERCELTHLTRDTIDYPRAVDQHRAYCERLETLGLEVLRLPAEERFPDGCFVEDVAVVLDEIAIVTRPGAASRRGETRGVAEALGQYRTDVATLTPPGTLDGGDVLVCGRRIYVGRTPRTNAAGIEALGRFVARYDYQVIPVAVRGCLHLKSAVSAVDDHTLLANRQWFDTSGFHATTWIDVADGEPGAANVLRVRAELWAHPGYPRTFEHLARAGHPAVAMDISEFVKAEAALTCKSLIFKKPGVARASRDGER